MLVLLRKGVPGDKLALLLRWELVCEEDMEAGGAYWVFLSEWKDSLVSMITNILFPYVFFPSSYSQRI